MAQMSHIVMVTAMGYRGLVSGRMCTPIEAKVGDFPIDIGHTPQLPDCRQSGNSPRERRLSLLNYSHFAWATAHHKSLKGASSYA